MATIAPASTWLDNLFRHQNINRRPLADSTA
jgi:hypothetical protein